MASLLPHAAAAKAIAVVFVLAIIAMRDDRRRFLLGLAVIPAAAAAHGWSDGAMGVAFAASGAALAFLFTAPLVVIGGLDSRETAFSAAAGAILGPAGAAVAFIVALCVFALRRGAGNRSPIEREDRLLARYRCLFEGATAGIDGAVSRGGEPIAGEPAAETAAVASGGISPARLFDWGRGTALAVLAALLLGMPL